MALADINSREAILQAVAEYDRLGQYAFLKKYGFGRAKEYFLLVDGREYDSKAIVGAAHGYQFPNVGPLRRRKFKGGSATVQRLLELLGFEVRVARPSVALPAPRVESPPAVATPIPEVSAVEGREFLRLHRVRERNRELVARKKRQVLADTNRLACESCGFDFAEFYGPRGDGFAECHHTLPISQSTPGRRTKLSELAVVCANCHRMLHRQPWVSVPELHALIRSRRCG